MNVQTPPYLCRLAEAVVLFSRSNDRWHGAETFRRRLEKLTRDNWLDYQTALEDAEIEIDRLIIEIAERKVNEAALLVEESQAFQAPYHNLAIDAANYYNQKLGWH